MSTGYVITLVTAGIVLAALLCMVAVVIAVRWTRHHPDRGHPHARHGHRV